MPNIQPKMDFLLTVDLPKKIESTSFMGRMTELFLVTGDRNFKKLCGAV
jgi:hypothetical protein